MSRMLRYLTLLVLILCSVTTIAATSQPLDSDWEYRWGDSSFDGEIPVWTLEDNPNAWKPIDFPSNPPNRDGQQNAWYRITLPEGTFVDPVVYIYSIDLIAEVYLEQELIYQFGDFDSEGKGHFIGWPWHMIDLPDGYADQTLYFRVFSDYTDIGLWGEVKIIERSDLLLFILSKSYINLTITAFCFFIALLAFAFAMMQREQRQFLYLSLFSLAACGKLLGETQAVQLLFDAPLFRTYLTALSYFSMPIWIALLLREWLPHSKTRWLSGVAWIHTIYLITSLSAASLSWIHLSITYPVFDLLFTGSLIFLLSIISRQFKQMELSQRGVMLAFSAFALLLLIDMGVAHGFLPWARVPLSVGALLFAVTLVIIFLRDFAVTQRMVRQLNTALEQRVEERTEKLQRYIEKEQRYLDQLKYIQEFDRRLETLVRELQSLHSTEKQLKKLPDQLPDLFNPLMLNVLLSDIPESEETAELDERSLKRYVISYTDLQQHSQHCVKLAINPSPFVESFSEHLLDDFMHRLTERISFTITSQLMHESLERMSYEDFLTGLNNRRFFDQAFAREALLAERHGHPLAILMCDIDHFKAYNDNQGHSAGDVALQQVAQVLKEHFRETDIPCRYGGEEFVLIMPNADLDSTLERAETLRQRIENLDIVASGQALEKITISIGIAVWPTISTRADELINAADKALYDAKNLGRNRVEIAKKGS